MRSLITLFILLCAGQAIACSCAYDKDFKTADDLKRYDFVALIEIIGLPPVADSYANTRKNGNIHFKTLELFKGKISSWAIDPDFNNNCVLDMKRGERWLFFGYTDKGKIQISQCSPTVRYADVNGVRDWWYLTGIKELDILRKLYNHPLPKIPVNKILYANSKVEIIQSIKKGDLNGLRKIYYPSGRLYLIEYFRNGKRIGYRKEYSTSGQLISEVIYKKGLIGKITNYWDSTVLMQMMRHEARRSPYPTWHLEAKPVKRKLDSLLKTIAWLHIGDVKIFESNGRAYKIYDYYPTGIIRHKELVDWKKKVVQEIDYNESGKLVMHNIYDKLKGKQIENYYLDGYPQKVVKNCDRCSLYFNTATPIASMPEPVYIR